VNFAVIRRTFLPTLAYCGYNNSSIALVFKYAALKNPAAPFAALVVRAHFLSLANDELAHSGIMLARAHLCELLAMKLLAPFAADKVFTVAVLSMSWSPLAGAPEAVLVDVKAALGNDAGAEDPQNALEMAIATSAKRFIASPVVQTVVNELYRGDVVFGMLAHRSLLADNYKPREIEIYDVRKHPFLNHYRSVPPCHTRLPLTHYGQAAGSEIRRNPGVLQLCASPAHILVLSCWLGFLIFWLIRVLTKGPDRDNHHLRVSELIFAIFAVSFVLEEYTAQKEHGWSGKPGTPRFSLTS
jgi:hypothetical protein